MPKEKLKEADYFLKVPKLLFKQGMSPAEILIVSQILEFTNKRLPCYLTDAELALNIGASESTISRTIRDLVSRKIVERETKMINGKRVRTLKADTSNLTPREVRKKLDHTVNLTVPSKQIDCTIQSNCRYPSQQIDRIKDKEKDKKEDNSIDKEKPLLQKNCSSESTPIIYNIIDNKINKDIIDNSLEITQQQLTLLANPRVIGEDEQWQYVANGNKTFKMKKEGVSAQVR